MLVQWLLSVSQWIPVLLSSRVWKRQHACQQAARRRMAQGRWELALVSPRMHTERRCHLQPTANAGLLKGLGGRAAIARAPAPVAPKTQETPRVAARRHDAGHEADAGVSTFILGLACGGHTADPGGSGFEATQSIEHHVRLQDEAATRARAKFARPPRRQVSSRRPGWAVAAGHTPHLDASQSWNEQWLHTVHWYDDLRFDDDSEAVAWRVTEAHAAKLSRAQGGDVKHPASDDENYIPSHPRPTWDSVMFEPEVGDIFDDWLNGGDDGRQQASGGMGEGGQSLGPRIPY